VLPLEKVLKRAAQLGDLRELLAARAPADVSLAYAHVLEVLPAFGPQQLERVAVGRCGDGRGGWGLLGFALVGGSAGALWSRVAG